METDAEGRTELVTYVSPEDFERMTEAERKRLNARVGVTATVGTWGAQKRTETLSTADLEKALQE